VLVVSFEQLKREIAALTEAEQAALISYTLQLRHAHHAVYQREVVDRLNDADKAHWLTPNEFDDRLDDN